MDPIRQKLIKLQEEINKLYEDPAFYGLPTYESVTTGLLSGEICADQSLGANERPLRLLSLGTIIQLFLSS